MITLSNIAAGILELESENPEHDLFGGSSVIGTQRNVRVWEHSVGFSVYVEAHGNQFLFGIGDPADSPDQDVTGGTLNWEKTLHGESLARELECDPQEFESYAGADTWFGIATGSETWTRAQILDKIREIIEYA